MATLKHEATGRTLLLAARTLIGRSPSSDLRLTSRHTSGEHASAGWSGDRWQIRDLSSRNGTRIDGAALTPGRWSALEEGALLEFGGPDERWRLIDESPPATRAEPLEPGGEPQFAVGGLLLLPDPEAPAAAVQRAEAGWSLDLGDAPLRPLRDREIVIVGGRGFRLHLDRSTPETLALGDAPEAALRVRFEVSRDEEFVHLYARLGDRRLDLGARVHNYTLLTLARARLEDRARGDLSPAEEGWIYQDDLLRMLAVDSAKLNMDIFRARRHLAMNGLEQADALVERRRPTRQLRFGVADVEIVPL